MNTPTPSNEHNQHFKSRLDEFKRDYNSHRQNYDRMLYGTGPSTSTEKLQVRLFGVAFLLIGLVMGVGGIISLFTLTGHLFEFQIVLICAAPILIVIGLITILRGKLALGKSWLFRNRRETLPSVAPTDGPSPYAMQLNNLDTTEHPMQRILVLFSKRGIVMLALILVGGLIFGLHLDERIAIFLVGIIFALAGAGQLVVTRKDTRSAKWLRYFLYVISVSVLLFGVLVSISALLLMIAGRQLTASGM